MDKSRHLDFHLAFLTEVCYYSPLSMTSAIWLFILIVLSGFFSGAEVALLTVSRVKVRSFVHDKRAGASALQKLKRNTRRMIITILIGNNVVNIAAAAIATVLATKYFGSLGVGIVTGALTAVILIFGEITPKSLASRHAAYFALRIASVILWLEYALYPLVVMFEWLTGAVDKLVKVTHHDQMTERDIKSMVQFGVEENIVAPHEQFIINRALAFSDQTARGVMIPLQSVFMLQSETSVEDGFHGIIESGFSRVPLYGQSRSEIVGLVLIKDVAKELVSDWGHDRLIEIAVPPILVPEKIRIDYLFRIFQKQHMHMAIVHSAEGKAVGIVTLEDLIEELVGEIHDESDTVQVVET